MKRFPVLPFPPKFFAPFVFGLFALGLCPFKALAFFGPTVSPSASLSKPQEELFMAVKLGRVEDARKAIEAGANPNLSDSLKTYPLDMVNVKNLEMFEVLLNGGADPNNITGSQPPLFRIAAYTYAEAPGALELLLKAGAKTDFVDTYGNTVMHQAVASNNPAVLDLLHQKGAGVNAANKYGGTPLMNSLSNRHERSARWLLEKGADVKVATPAGYTALHYAADSPDTSWSIPLLVKKGAAVDAQTEDGTTPFIRAMDYGQVMSAQVLKDLGADVEHKQKNGQTAMSRACVENKTERMFALLRMGFDPKVLCPDKSNLLHKIAISSTAKLEWFQEAIDLGVSASAADNMGFTPLFWLAGSGNPQGVEIARLLINKGADVNASPNIGGPPIAKLVMDGWASGETRNKMLKLFLEKGADPNARDREGNPIILVTADRQFWPEVKTLLENGAHTQVSASKNLRTPLHLAAGHGHSESVRLLLAKGAKTDVQDYEKATPLLLATVFQKTEVVKELAGKPGQDIPNKDGFSPLMAAAFKQDQSSVAILLANDANVNFVNEKGETPLHAAAAGGDVSIVEKLIEKGADVKAKTKEGLTPWDMAQRFNKGFAAEALKNKGGGPGQ